MRTSSCAVALASLLLGACANNVGTRGADPTRPQVSIGGDGKIVVVPPVLVFDPGMSREVIFSLPPDSKLTFPSNGVVIEGKLLDKMTEDRSAVLLDRNQQEITCRLLDGRKQFRCDNNYKSPGVFKYTIRIDGVSGALDPNWVNPK